LNDEEKRLEALKFKMSIRKILDHYITVVFMTFLAIYALFFDDIRILAFDKKYDDIFYGITAFAVIMFSIEIIISSYAKPDYPLHFFFYLDIISTLSMIPDCGWIWELIINQDLGLDIRGSTDLAKATRAGRVTRIIRIIRLIRLIRIVKLYKQTVIAQKKAKEFVFNKKQGGMLKGLEIKKPAEVEIE
jgi:hypothetical protein